MGDFANFRAINRAFLSKASPTARHVLLAIAKHCGTGLAPARPSLRTLVKLTGRTDKTVSAAIDELERLGELRVERADGLGRRCGKGGRGNANRYWLLIEPDDAEQTEQQDRNGSDVSRANAVVVPTLPSAERSEWRPKTSELLPPNVGVAPTEENKKRFKKSVRAYSPASPTPLRVSTKSSKPKTGDSLAVAAWKRLTGKQLAPSAAKDIDDAVLDIEIERWERVLKKWNAKNNPSNVEGQLDWFLDRGGKVPPEFRRRRENSTAAPTAAPRVPTDDPDALRDEALPPPGVAPALWHGGCAVAALIESRHEGLLGVGSQRWALSAVAWIRATDPDAEPRSHVEAARTLVEAAQAGEAEALATIDDISRKEAPRVA